MWSILHLYLPLKYLSSLPDAFHWECIRYFFVRSGILDKDIYIETTEAAPLDEPLSPLLANDYLNKLDWDLEKSGYRFIRYADDFVINVKSKRAGARIMGSITKSIEKDLGLTINQKKSKVCSATSTTFPGFNIQKRSGKLDADRASRKITFSH